MNDELNEEHTLTSPQLIGTDQEKIAALEYWADFEARKTRA